MKRSRWKGIALVSPAAVLILTLMILPMFYTAYISLTKINNLQVGPFVGFDNYARVFADKAILRSISVGFQMSMLALALAMALGMLTSLWLNSFRGARAHALQLLCLIPWFTSLIISALTWRWLVHTDYGLINSLLRGFGQGAAQIMESPTYSFLMVSFIMAWRTAGYIMILVLSGLKALSDDMLEAARVDGASYFQTLVRIKLPNIKPQIILSFIMITLSNFNNSTIPLAFSNGGPAGATTTVALKLYTLGFKDLNFAKGSALSVIVLAINLVIIIFYMRSMRYER